MYGIGAALAAACLALTTLAQTPAATRIRGTIEAVDGHTLTIASREGPKLSVKLADAATVTTVKAVDLGTIGPGSYVGIAAEPDGKEWYRAQEVLVFPEAMRGVGEGHYPWDLSPGSSMTNGTLTGVVQEQAGRSLELSYKDQSTRITVPPGTPVVTIAPAAWADLKPGIPVFLSALKQPDGTFAASRLTIGKDGVAPPM